MRVLVTGGTGFLGAFAVPKLLSAGHEVVCLVRDPERGARLKTTLVIADLENRLSTLRAFTEAEAEVLVNLASLGFGHAPAIVDAATRSGIRSAVYVSTTAVTTTLHVPTKQVRLAAEATIEASPTPSTIVRPTMIYGAPGDRNMERLLRILHRTPVFPLLGAQHLHQPVHVEDLASTITAAVARPEARGRTFTVAGPEPLPFRQIVNASSEALGRVVRTIPLPTRPILAATRLIERAGRRGPVSAEQLERLMEDKSFDINPARDVLDHDPRSFESGIRGEAELLDLS